MRASSTGSTGPRSASVILTAPRLGNTWTRIERHLRAGLMILSALDLSPVTGEATQAQAVRETIQIAKAAERFGYHRLWLAEHHNIQGLGSPAPEILIAALTQATTTLRLGS